ncbi:holo-[acyl-carrier-protein] synthase [Desulfomicrobium escambiense]|uniref:holo-[acyl-carrier-protein] synthase n=1 Tax=Desulfomicrobium escambiense TaxID=29503 RepID=UPI0003F9E79B|nr:holo-[acyl-carrier-protein] synthase [Desulfomicrobium escambiense]
MIIGVGIDIAELDRIARSYERFGGKFCARILTAAESSAMPGNAVPFLASRFAAKEAASKALGTGFSQGVTFQDIEVRSDDLGKPTIHFHNAAQARFRELGAARAHLSISHGRDNAVAVVILEA